MTIAEREQQILRIKNASFQSELDEHLESHLRNQVVMAVQSTIEAALVEEVVADAAVLKPKPRRSGYFQRTLDTQYGRIDQLAVPKLRHSNKERSWRILERYQRSLQGLLDFAGYLYIMGLSLRDLQEALYFLLGSVISRTAVNHVTLKVQKRMDAQRQAPITNTPPILIVDGVWVEIQYSLDEFKLDQAGHQRQRRQAQDRVILVAMAVWPDGLRHILHYEVAEVESEQAWATFFAHMIARGLNHQAVKLLVSDGSKGLLAAMKQCLPNAQQQRCMTHKVRGMKPYLTYDKMPETDELGHALTISEAKKQRWQTIKRDALFHDSTKFEDEIWIDFYSTHKDSHDNDYQKAQYILIKQIKKLDGNDKSALLRCEQIVQNYLYGGIEAIEEKPNSYTFDWIDIIEFTQMADDDHNFP